MLIDDGFHLFKFWFSIDINEQKKRLEERLHNPLKQWKLSGVDMEAQEKWKDFTHYKEKMFNTTSTQKSPWIIINGNEREIARRESMRYILNQLEYDKKGDTSERLIPNSSVIKRY